jgi:hypothetical protein
VALMVERVKSTTSYAQMGARAGITAERARELVARGVRKVAYGNAECNLKGRSENGAAAQPPAAMGHRPARAQAVRNGRNSLANRRGIEMNNRGWNMRRRASRRRMNCYLPQSPGRAAIPVVRSQRAVDLASACKSLARNRKSCTGVAATKGHHLSFAARAATVSDVVDFSLACLSSRGERGTSQSGRASRPAGV